MRVVDDFAFRTNPITLPPNIQKAEDDRHTSLHVVRPHLGLEESGHNPQCGEFSIPTSNSNSQTM